MQQQAGGRNSERNSASPNQNNHQSSPHYHSNNNQNHNNHQRKSNHNNNGRHQQKSPSSASYFNSNPTNCSTVSPFKYMSKNGNGYIVGRTTPPNAVQNQQSSSIPIQQQYYHNNGNRMSPGGIYTPGTTNNVHQFASPKYFDSPAPNSLPRPPTHWTTRGMDLPMVKTPPTTTMASTVSSKRRLFNNIDGGKTASNLLIDALQQSTAPLKASHKKDIIHAGGCASGSDIFSHNLKLMLNVQA
jgi:hypothetical protein